MIKKTSVVDQPKEHNSEDLFGIDKYEKALVKFIENADTPITIALQGEWGSGKTSLMNTLEHQLTYLPDAPFHRIWINTWQHSLMHSPEEAVVMILSGIIEQIGEASKNDDQLIQAKRFSKYFGKWMPQKETAGKMAKTGTKFVLNVIGNIGSVEKLGNALVDATEGGEKKSKPAESEIAELKNAIHYLIDEILEKSKRNGF
ncbi:MAG: P-loop NTPase fold protein, partial [Victivallaceae bacterium]